MTLLNVAAPVRATPIEHDNVECTVTMRTPFIRTRDAAWTSAPVGVWHVRRGALPRLLRRPPRRLMGERIDDIIVDEPLDPVNRVILIDRLEVDVRFRGQRLGPHLLTTLIDSVGGLGDLVVLHATPLQWREVSPTELDEAKAKVRAVHESMGFTTSGDDIFWHRTAHSQLHV